MKSVRVGVRWWEIRVRRGQNFVMAARVTMKSEMSRIRGENRFDGLL